MNFSRPFFLRLTQAAIVLAALPACAQTPSKELSIGAPAPALSVTWVKGAPIAKLDPEGMYVLEFWASWCGPCRAAMPHLSELARKHQGKVAFIGVNVWESGYRDKRYDAFLPQVKKFVDGMGDKMAYHVAMDDNALTMTRTWMEAANQQGIPASFLVKGGKVIWIGHPGDLDKVIEEVQAGTYDLAATAKAFNEANQKQRDLAPDIKKVTELMKDVDSAIAVQAYAKALKQIDQASVGLRAELQSSMVFLRLKVLVRSDLDQFFALARKEAAADPRQGMAAADVILKLKDEGKSEKLCLFAVEMYEDAIAKDIYPDMPKAYYYNWMGICLERCGHLAEAVKAQAKGLELAKADLAAGKEGGITKDLVQNYEETLADYKRKLAAGK